MSQVFTLVGKLSGLLTELYIVFFITRSVVQNPSFNFRQHSFCYCGTTPSTALFYNISMCLLAFARTFWVLTILYYFSLLTHLGLLMLLLIASLALLFAGLVPSNRSATLHNFFGFTMIFCSFLFFVLFHILIFPTYPVVSVVGGSILLLMIVGSSLLFARHKIGAISAGFFLSSVLLWDIFMTIVLFSL